MNRSPRSEVFFFDDGVDVDLATNQLVHIQPIRVKAPARRKISPCHERAISQRFPSISVPRCPGTHAWEARRRGRQSRRRRPCGRGRSGKAPLKFSVCASSSALPITNYRPVRFVPVLIQSLYVPLVSIPSTGHYFPFQSVTVTSTALRSHPNHQPLRYGPLRSSYYRFRSFSSHATPMTSHSNFAPFRSVPFLCARLRSNYPADPLPAPLPSSPGRYAPIMSDPVSGPSHPYGSNYCPLPSFRTLPLHQPLRSVSFRDARLRSPTVHFTWLSGRLQSCRRLSIPFSPADPHTLDSRALRCFHFHVLCDPYAPIHHLPAAPLASKTAPVLSVRCLSWQLQHSGQSASSASILTTPAIRPFPLRRPGPSNPLLFLSPPLEYPAISAPEHSDLCSRLHAYSYIRPIPVRSNQCHPVNAGPRRSVPTKPFWPIPNMTLRYVPIPSNDRPLRLRYCPIRSPPSRFQSVPFFQSVPSATIAYATVECRALVSIPSASPSNTLVCPP